MSVALQVILIFASVITTVYVMRKIRKAQLQLEDSLFWIIMPIVLIIIGIFPEIALWAAEILGFQASINFIFLLIIFILLMKSFLLSIKISQLDNKLKKLVQEYALEKNTKKEGSA